MSTTDPVDLMRRMADRDASALSDLYDLYKDALFGLIHRIVANGPVAEDLLQEVFLQAWNRADRFNPEKGSVSTWLLTIARNMAIDFLRSKKSQERAVDPSDDVFHYDQRHQPATPLDFVLQSETGSMVSRALAELNDDQKQCLEMAYFGGMTQSEIAATLNVPIGTIKTRMRQGMIKLGQFISVNYGEGNPA